MPQAPTREREDRQIGRDPIQERDRELAKAHGLRMPSPSESVAGGKSSNERPEKA
jgi:hypothetical protein